MNTDTFVRLLQNSGFYNVSQDSAFVYMEDPTCVLRSFETFTNYAWLVIVCATALLLMGWGFSMIRGSKNDLFTNMRNLILIFGILGAAKPIMNLIYGDDLFARGCDTIAIPIDQVNQMLAARNARNTSTEHDILHEEFDIYDSGATDENTAPDENIMPNPDDDNFGPTHTIAQPLSAAADGKDVIYSYPDGAKIRRTGGTRAWRNNNPGNIMYGEFARNAGAIGYAGKVGNGNFAVFPDQQTGMNAIRKLLRTDKYRRKTVAQAIYTWCPDSSSQMYRTMVNKMTGINLNTPMSQLSDAQLESITQAIFTVEGWIPGTEKRV